MFTPFVLRGLRLKNRVVVAPMHQYAGVDGYATDWHLMNAGRYAAGGAGLVMMESTKVERRGCGTLGDLGLWDDKFVPALARCADFVHSCGAAAGIQLGHSGRKSRIQRPWEGGQPLRRSDAIADWPLLNALVNTAAGATWVSIHHGGGTGIGYSQHAGMVVVADGTELAAQKLERVLTTDPGMGVIRHVDAGSCNGCEVEVGALNNPIYDVERFGVHFVASPRHADVLLVTGVASRNMVSALRRTYEATPDPKVVVAVGACACGGGIFGDTYASGGGIGDVVPVDVYVPGCPPRPEALLYGLLLAVARVG